MERFSNLAMGGGAGGDERLLRDLVMDRGAQSYIAIIARSSHPRLGAAGIAQCTIPQHVSIRAWDEHNLRAIFICNSVICNRFPRKGGGLMFCLFYGAMYQGP